MKFSHLIAISTMALSTNVFSNEISYDYIQGTYHSISDDSLGVDIDADGFSFGGSFSISDNLALTAGFGAASYDRVAGIDIDTSDFSFGMTFHQSVASGTDVYGNFSIVNAEYELDDGTTRISDDDMGNVIAIGVRHMASEKIEIGANISRTDVFSDTSNSFGVGAIFFINDKVAFGVGYSSGDDVDALSLGLRANLK